MQESLKSSRSNRAVRMVRKQVFITAEQNSRLKTLARRLALPEAELVRSGLDSMLDEKERAGVRDDWRRAIDEFVATPGDNSALARRVEETKKQQAKLWRQRLARTRKLMGGG